MTRGAAVKNKGNAGRIVITIAVFVIVAVAIALGVTRGRNSQSEISSTQIAETTALQETDEEESDFEHMIESGSLIDENSVSDDSDSGSAAISDGESEVSETSEASSADAGAGADNAQAETTVGVSAEFKHQVDDIVAFYESYCRFLKNYTNAAASGNYTDMINEYTRFMSDYAKYSDRLNKLNSSQSSMTPEELDYWLKAYAKIMNMLASAGQ